MNAPGDSVLAEFGSVVDAVKAAVEIQKRIGERNDGEPDDRYDVDSAFKFVVSFEQLFGPY